MPGTLEQTGTATTCKVKGEELLQKVKDVIREGNARRITVIGEEGRTILEIPLTAGVVATVMAPALVAVGAIAALAKHYTLQIETADKDDRALDPQC